MEGVIRIIFIITVFFFHSGTSITALQGNINRNDLDIAEESAKTTTKLSYKGHITMKHLAPKLSKGINNILPTNDNTPQNSHTSGAVVKYEAKRTNMHPLQIFSSIVDEIKMNYCTASEYVAQNGIHVDSDSVAYSKFKTMEYFQGELNMNPETSDEEVNPVCGALVLKKNQAAQSFLNSLDGLHVTDQLQLKLFHGLQNMFFSGITSTYANLLIMSVHHLETIEYIWKLMGRYCRVQLDMYGLHWTSGFSSNPRIELVPPHESSHTETNQHSEESGDEEEGSTQEKFFSTVFSIQKRSNSRNDGVSHTLDSFIERGLKLYQSMVTSILTQLYYRMSLITAEGSMLQLGILGSVFVSNYAPLLALFYGASLLFARVNYEILTELRPVSVSTNGYSQIDIPLSLPSPQLVDMDANQTVSDVDVNVEEQIYVEEGIVFMTENNSTLDSWKRNMNLDSNSFEFETERNLISSSVRFQSADTFFRR